MKWISVDDMRKRPKKSGATLIKINGHDTNIIKRYYSSFCGFWTHNLNKVHGVTHWRPIGPPEKAND